MPFDLIRLAGKYTKAPPVGADQYGVEVGLAGVVGMRNATALAQLVKFRSGMLKKIKIHLAPPLTFAVNAFDQCSPKLAPKNAPASTHTASMIVL